MSSVWPDSGGETSMPRLPGQLKILQKSWENVMKNLLFFTAAAFMRLTVAVACDWG
jgi:hypothetical protein